MNCKQGDTAIVISGDMFGHILKCVKYLGYVRVGIHYSKHDDLWEVDEKIEWVNPFTGEEVAIEYFPDKWLMPLAGDGVDDEIKKEKKPFKKSHENITDFNIKKVYEYEKE